MKELEGKKPGEIIRLAMSETGFRQADIAEKLGLNQSAISGAINRTKFSIDSLSKVLSTMGYSVMVVHDTEDGFDVLCNADEQGAIQKALDASGTRKIDLAEKLGIAPSGVSVHVNRPRIGADILVRMMNAMGYKVIAGKDGDDGFKPEWELVTK